MSRLSPPTSNLRQILRLTGLPFFLLALSSGAVGAQTPEEMIWDFAETASGFTLIGEIEVGSLQAGSQMTFPLELDGGQDYMMVGFCDSDCDDMDMVLLGSSGSELESDVLPDAQPILIYTPPDTDLFIVSMDMVSCSVEPCEYAVGIFQGDFGDDFGLRDEGIVPGGIAVAGIVISEATYRGTLEGGDERLREGEFYDEYSVQAVAGQTVIVDLRSPDFDTYLILEAPDGTQERNDDYDGDTMRSHIEVVAQESGAFSILVTTFSAESIGDYTVQVVVVEGS